MTRQTTRPRVGATHPLGRMERIAILGGTFDPIHDGHLALAKRFAELLALDELVLMPAGQPWHKEGVSAAQHRLEMTKLAAAQLTLAHTRITVGTDEIEREGDTYTVDTLKAWRQRIGPNSSLSLIIGADQLLSLDRWHDWLSLFELAHVCVAARPGFNLDEAPTAVKAQIERRRLPLEAIKNRAHGGLFIDRALELDISATQIRQCASQRLADDSKACEHVPDTVWHYIRQHRLYGEPPVSDTQSGTQ